MEFVPVEDAIKTHGDSVRWIQSGARAVWTARSGKMLLVDVVGWASRKKVLVRDKQGREFGSDPDRLHEWIAGDTPMASAAVGQRVAVQSQGQISPMAIDPARVREIIIKVRGKTQYVGPVTKKAGAMVANIGEHGRHMVVTLKMHDGTKQAFRGNGVQIQ